VGYSLFLFICFAGRPVGEGTHARASFVVGRTLTEANRDLCNLDRSCTLLHFSLTMSLSLSLCVYTAVLFYTPGVE
jgi:hypothetical protein